MVFLIGSDIIQWAYPVIITSFPFNALALSLFMLVKSSSLPAYSQVNPLISSQFKFVSPQRLTRYSAILILPYFSTVFPKKFDLPPSLNNTFADFVFGLLVLHFFAFDFLGWDKKLEWKIQPEKRLNRQFLSTKEVSQFLGPSNHVTKKHVFSWVIWMCETKAKDI